MVAPAVKTTTAAIAESCQAGAAPLAAAARFLAAPNRERLMIILRLGDPATVLSEQVMRLRRRRVRLASRHDSRRQQTR
jgi:hypothetical protein